MMAMLPYLLVGGLATVLALIIAAVDRQLLKVRTLGDHDD